MTEQCPSRAQGFFPITIFELFWSGSKNLEWDSLPNYVNLPSFIFVLGLGFPITSNEFFIAWEAVYRLTNLSFSFGLV